VLKFEWDDEKNRKNFLKHDLWFEQASSAFQDPNALVFDDPEHSKDEDRQLLLGLDQMLRILVVVFCERDGDTIRIISARKAKKQERARYEKGI
jgi:uncharacterized DUF497 family protein